MSEFTAAQILAIPMGENDSGEGTVGGYLAALLQMVWDEGEEFNGKRPFGTSGWQGDLVRPLVDAGVIDGSVDEHGDAHADDADVAEVVKLAISALRGTGSAKA
jgi:hypothetical protein